MYVAQLDNPVVLVTCTCTDPPAATLAKLQLSTPLVIEQPPTAGLMLQAGPTGKVSVRVTDEAAELPVLFTVIVYPIEFPAATVPASAVFVTLNVVHCTVIGTVVDVTEFAFVALAVA